MKFIPNFMLNFGLLSSVFDFLTFGVLYFMLDASPELFRSGWFVESVVSASLVVLIVRTRGPFWRSRPSTALTLSTLAVVAMAVASPTRPWVGCWDLHRCPRSFWGPWLRSFWPMSAALNG